MFRAKAVLSAALFFAEPVFLPSRSPRTAREIVARQAAPDSVRRALQIALQASRNGAATARK